jgi:hypothetical protein
LPLDIHLQRIYKARETRWVKGVNLVCRLSQSGPRWTSIPASVGPSVRLSKESVTCPVGVCVEERESVHTAPRHGANLHCEKEICNITCRHCIAVRARAGYGIELNMNIDMAMQAVDAVFLATSRYGGLDATGHEPE